MNKSDLRSGMIVTLRNGDPYMVLLNTGMPGDMEDVLIHKVGNDIGWMPLSEYADDLTFHDPDDDIFPSDPENDPEWDIIRVEAAREAAYLGIRKHYKTIWEREE